MASIRDWLIGGDHLDAETVKQYRQRARRADGSAWLASHGLPPLRDILGHDNVTPAKPDHLPPPNPVKTSPGLGDAVSAALALVGVTEERVSAWIGQPCGCGARKKKLNDLGAWAARVLLGDRSQPPLD